MPIDRKRFFDLSRPIFGGTLSQGQVDGLTILLDEWEKRAWTDLRWLAYILATTKHETANTMTPLAEYGHGAGHDYGEPDPVTGQRYYGRGFCQLTHKFNYAKFGDRLGIDLVNNPDLAMDPRIATLILFDGMINGLYTGVSLGKYFNTEWEDYVGARRIVNGTDQAPRIAGFAHAFLSALTPLHEVA